MYHTDDDCSLEDLFEWLLRLHIPPTVPISKRPILLHEDQSGLKTNVLVSTYICFAVIL